MVKVITTRQLGDRYFLQLDERTRRFHGNACIWFRPAENAVEPYYAGVTVFKEIRPNVFDSVKHSKRMFASCDAAETWAVDEYSRLRREVR